MQLNKLRILIGLLAIFGLTPGWADAQSGSFSPWTFKAGLGYEFLSQEYFLEAVSDTSTDPLLDQVSLETTYLDDIKGLVGVVYSPYFDQRLWLEAQYEQTPEILRARFLPDFRLKLGRAKLDLRGEFDLRQHYQDSAGIGDSYAFGRIDSRLTLPVRSSSAIKVKLLADAVRFDSTGDFTFNYSRLGGRIGWQESFENLSFLDAELFVVGRDVIDSTDLNYLNYGIEGRFFGFFGASEWDLFGRLERKNYNFVSGRNDFDRGELEVRGRIPVAGALSIRPEIGLEKTSFAEDDPVNFDYRRLSLDALGGLELSELTLAAGPAIEILEESEGDLTSDEDYTEIGLVLQIDYFDLSRMFGSLESTWGYRDLKAEDEFQSDFYFERLSLLADAKIVAGFSLNLLFAAEWEWHKVTSEDTRIFLFNSGLTYSF